MKKKSPPPKEKKFKDWSPAAQAAVTRLLDLMAGRTLTQEQHAFAGGFNSRTFRRWLKKEYEPTPEYLNALNRYIDRASK